VYCEEIIQKLLIFIILPHESFRNCLHSSVSLYLLRSSVLMDSLFSNILSLYLSLVDNPASNSANTGSNLVSKTGNLDMRSLVFLLSPNRKTYPKIGHDLFLLYFYIILNSLLKTILPFDNVSINSWN
jgi:hypothetical protein